MAQSYAAKDSPFTAAVVLDELRVALRALLYPSKSESAHKDNVDAKKEAQQSEGTYAPAGFNTKTIAETQAKPVLYNDPSVHLQAKPFLLYSASDSNSVLEIDCKLGVRNDATIAQSCNSKTGTPWCVSLDSELISRIWEAQGDDLLGNMLNCHSIVHQKQQKCNNHAFAAAWQFLFRLGTASSLRSNRPQVESSHQMQLLPATLSAAA
eukprot:scaffold211498_cov22-Tisochrysis_lutea.AAC.1